MFGRKYLTVPPASPEMSKLPLADHSRSRTPLSHACKMVSKLKVSPFHRVNSPEEDPVSSRRVDGIHLTTLTGVRILFVDV